MPGGCPRCGNVWLEIAPEGGRCPTHGFITRAEIDDRKSEPGAAASPPSHARAVVRRLSDVQREDVAWLWRHRVARGKLTILEGDPEVGKSYLTLALATAVTLGTALPDDDPDEAAEVLFLTAEDGLGDTVRPRAEDMGANLAKIHCLTAVVDDDGKEKHFSLADDLAALEEFIQTHNVALLVIDPINAYLGGNVNTNQDAALRAVLTPLAQLAERYNVAIVAIRHLTKGSRDRAIYRGQGSIAYVAAARTVLLVGKNPQDESERAVVCTKNNLAAHPAAIAYEIVEGQFRWKGLSNLSADDLLRPDSGETRLSLDAARDFLHEALCNGTRPATEVEKEAKAFGISIPTLRRAREALGVKASRLGEAGKQGGGVWLWSLPPAPAGLGDQPLDDQAEHLNNVITLTRADAADGTDTSIEGQCLDDQCLDDQPEHLKNLSTLTSAEPGATQELMDLVACIGCGTPIAEGNSFCPACLAKPPLLRMALTNGAHDLTNFE